jgi:hypothetical protein
MSNAKIMTAADAARCADMMALDMLTVNMPGMDARMFSEEWRTRWIRENPRLAKSGVVDVDPALGTWQFVDSLNRDERIALLETTWSYYVWISRELFDEEPTITEFLLWSLASMGVFHYEHRVEWPGLYDRRDEYHAYLESLAIVAMRRERDARKVAA